MHFSPKPLRALAALVPLLLPALAHSQPAPEDDAVVVSASRTEQRIRDAIPHTTVITAREIRDSQAIDLPALLRREAGFEFAQNGGVGTISGVFMRGGRSAHTLFLIDGVRIEDASSGQTAIQHILLDEVERVEIVRGNVSSLYGSGAIGGVVQVFTRRGRGKPAPSAEFTLGARGTARLRAGYGGQLGDTRFNLTVSQFDTRGYSAINPRQAPAANPEADGYSNTSAAASITQRISARHEAGVSFYTARGRADYDSAFSTVNAVHKSAQDLDTLSGYWEARLVDAWRSRLTLAQGSDYRTDTLNGNLASRSNTRNRQLIWDNRFAVATGHEVSVGIESLKQHLVNSGLARPTYHRDASTLRLGYLGSVGAHSLQFNARSESYSDFGAANTHFAGYGYALSEDWKLIASTSTAFRAPTFVDLFGFGGNIALKPERASTRELGLQWAAGEHRLRMAIFRTEYQDAITFSASMVRNVRRAGVDGYEASYSGVLAGFDLRASLTLQDAVDQEPNAAVLPAVRRARAYGSLAAYRTWGDWRMGAELLSSGRRPDTDIVSGARVVNDGYNAANLTARYRIDKHLYAALKLENAFDERYQLIPGYDTPRRGAFISVGWQP
ncbi:MAG: TonB-dependent receptor [Betaproteobacteria bacterium]|nr:TonB-dependent receptor [Betaproteobacteria bacterium]